MEGANLQIIHVFTVIIQSEEASDGLEKGVRKE